MDGFTGAWLVAWLIFSIVGIATIEVATIKPPVLVTVPLSEACAKRSSELGTVTDYYPAKGYGYLVPKQGGKKVFIHVNYLDPAEVTKMVKGQEVGYELASLNGHPYAAKVCT